MDTADDHTLPNIPVRFCFPLRNGAGADDGFADVGVFSRAAWASRVFALAFLVVGASGMGAFAGQSRRIRLHLFIGESKPEHQNLVVAHLVFSSIDKSDFFSCDVDFASAGCQSAGKPQLIPKEFLRSRFVHS